ncbi:MAG: hypothetical protein LH471_00430 [Salinibacterium sp.]|nr:hypothetical protein [Salinibacterium sp.]
MDSPSVNTSPRFRLAAAVAVAAALALVLAGCSAPGSIATETIRGVAPGVTLTDDEGLGERPVAVWTNDRTKLTVVTWGSSGCPSVPRSLEVPTESVLVLRFAAPTDQACTADFAPTSHVMTTPAGVGSGAVTVEMIFEARQGDDPLAITVPVQD